uniref:Conotoxin Mr14.3 n=1 Tax=Conus marmoreus TaxID=42752 RepID=M9PMT6_CONMR|nr:conotoxin Mr14.3 [Conus marmoreus]
MPSVRSVTCCCLLWMMFSVQLVNPGSPGTAQLFRHRTARVLAELILEIICLEMCEEGVGEEPFCHCTEKRDAVFSRIRRRKRSTAV